MPKNQDFIHAGNCAACGTGKIELQVWFAFPPFGPNARIGPGLNLKQRIIKLTCRNCGLLYDKIAPRSKLCNFQLDHVQKAAKPDCNICLGFGYCRIESQDEIIECPDCISKEVEPPAVEPPTEIGEALHKLKLRPPLDPRGNL